MKQLIPTFTKVNFGKSYLNPYNIRQRKRTINILTDNDLIDNLTQNDIDSERRGELPFRYEELYKQKYGNKGFKSKVKTDKKKPKKSKIPLLPNHRNVMTDPAVLLKSNEEYIEMYKMFLQEKNSEPKTKTITFSNTITENGKASTAVNTLPNAHTVSRPYSSKPILKKPLRVHSSYKLTKKHNRPRIMKERLPSKGTNSNIFLTTTNISSQYKKQKTYQNTSSSLMTFKNETDTLQNFNSKEYDSSDISAMEYPKEVFQKPEEGEEAKKIKKKYQLDSLKDDIAEFEKKNQEYDEEKVKENEKMVDPFIRTQFHKPKYSENYLKKQDLQKVPSKIKEYIQNTSVTRPFCFKKKFKKFDEIFLRTSNKRMTFVKKLKEEHDDIEVPNYEKKKKNWIDEIDDNFKQEIVQYQKDLDNFVYIGQQGYYYEHSDTMNTGEKAYKDAMGLLQSDWLSEIHHKKFGGKVKKMIKTTEKH